MNLADELRRIPLGLLWAVVFFIVVIFGWGFTPWAAIKHLIVNMGTGDGGGELLAFTAGYTLPLTAGFGLISFLLLTDRHKQYSTPAQLVGGAAILLVAGLVSHVLGLGLPPDFAGWEEWMRYPLYISLPLVALSAYLKSYAIGLMISALAIGFGAAIWLERKVHISSGQPENSARW